MNLQNKGGENAGGNSSRSGRRSRAPARHAEGPAGTCGWTRRQPRVLVGSSLLACLALVSCHAAEPVHGGATRSGDDSSAPVVDRSGVRVEAASDSGKDDPTGFCSAVPEEAPLDVCSDLVEAHETGLLDELPPEEVFDRAYGARRRCPEFALELMLDVLPDLLGADHAMGQVKVAFIQIQVLDDPQPWALEMALAGAAEAEVLSEPCIAAAAWRRVVTYYLERSELEAAAEPGESAIMWAEACGDRGSLGRSWYLKSEWWRQRGDQMAQYDALRWALDFSREGSREHLFYSQHIAQLRADLGDVADEGERFALLLDEALKGGYTLLAFELQLRLAEVYRDLGWYDDALGVLDDACRTTRQDPGLAEKPSLVNVSRAWVLVEAGRTAEARALMDKVPFAEFQDRVARYRHLWKIVQGKILLAEGRPDEAAQAFQWVLNDAPPPEPEPEWRARFGMARAARQAGRDEEARRWLWDAVKGLESQRERTVGAFWSLAYLSQREGLYRMWIESLLEAWERGGRPAGAPSREEGRVRRAERGHSQAVVSPVDEVGGEEPAGTLDAQALEQAFVTGTPTSDDLLAAVEKVMSQAFAADLFQDQGGVVGRLTESPRGYRAWESVAGAWVSGSTLRSMVPQGIPVLVLLPLDQSLLLLEVRHGRVDVHRVEQPRSVWVAFVQRLQQSIRQHRRLPGDVLTGLGDVLLEPVFDRLPKDGSPVGFVLADVMEAIPVAALQVRGRYLVESCSPFELPNLRSVVWLDRHEPPTGPIHALAVGYGPDLNLVRAEVSLLEQPGFSSQVLLGDEATVDGVREALAGQDVIHMAMHAVPPRTTRAREPWVTRVDVARVQLADGDLSAVDLQAQHLNARLVVLSGCETRVGRPGHSEHGYGALHRSMLVAGADAVVASRWRVGDETTFALMSEFYKHYPRMGRAQALAEAQRAMLQSNRRASTLTREAGGPHVALRKTGDTTDDRIPYAAPWSWAAFAMVGRWD